ncbi:DUF2127 domain-containing protein [Amnibacterium kyonggiense]|uniref:Putative membrane protein n=1 Tax=Amnibacterium kyonggiense TaxID=595671 RepID=A0A4R7FTK5_9MICO|nr:DUF2127 domain-containing protein [Amnibacterium kyonggiense]TDS81049.1 putative membrane protein [Amnibacterium kyonggiense]
MPSASRPRRSAFERAYTIVVLVKGFDGAVELIAGLVLLLAPDSTAEVLFSIADELAEGPSMLRQTLAQSVESAGGGVATAATPFAVFLLVHGVVKLVTVTALLRRAIAWYPWAMGALAVLLVAQLVDVVRSPAAGGWVLAAFDVAVLVLVAWEYRRLRRELRDERAAAEPARAPDPTGAR